MANSLSDDNHTYLPHSQQAQKDEKELLYNTIIDVNRKQYAKLLSLERREMINQKDISDTWVKFVYLLLERSLAYCEEKEILFHNMDEYAQTLLLRSQANIMRSSCNLPPYEVRCHHNHHFPHSIYLIQPFEIPLYLSHHSEICVICTLFLRSHLILFSVDFLSTFYQHFIFDLFSISLLLTGDLRSTGRLCHCCQAVRFSW